ncbi:MAG TPA: glycosyl hydrolase 115 family protein [Phnomibacter sp.]|nr:glycosyl hydrolase 115 family protein [Phnomibacter sp.]
MKGYNQLVWAIFFISFLSTGLLALAQTSADGNTHAYVGGQSFPLFNARSVASIIIDDQEAKVVSIAADALVADVALVSGKQMQRKNQPTNSTIQIIAGTIGNSKIVDELVQQKGIDIAAIKGQWETFMIKAISPTQLLVAGSDARGTAYGIFHLSKLMGVSPWVWWADALPAKKTQLYISGTYVSRTPSVKYRGVFLNDEDWGLRPWAAKNLEPETNNIGPKTYAKIFELLLRLRANLIWPAMHPGTTAFFNIPGNTQMAADYAIVVGSSHAEPMLRNNVGEWNEKTMGAFNYLSNHDAIYRYWEERAVQSKGVNAVYTLGLRGVHDGEMQGAKTLQEQKTLMGVAVKEQREMLAKHINPSIEKVPQAFIPYKEVQDIYDYGFEVPKDATLIWCDDNYGYIKHFPNEKERAQKGGNGVYYHISYWGRPHDYLWLASTHPAQVYTQMRMAYEKGAKDMWVVNVGDIKPGEYLSELFLDMAWNMDSIANNRKGLEQHLQSWIAREFGAANAKSIASVMNEYYRLAYIRKPEFMGATRTEERDPKYKIVTDLPWTEDEIQQRLKAYSVLDKKVMQLAQSIPANKRDAWFELVEYPVRSAAAINKKLLNAQLARHGKAAWSLSNVAYDTIVALTDRYNALANGKWKYMMDHQPRKLEVFDKVAQTTSDKPLVQPVLPLFAFNGTGYRNYIGEKPVAHGLGYAGEAVSVAKGSSVQFEAMINKTDSIRIQLALAPNHPAAGTSIRYSIQVGTGPVQTIDYATQGRSEEWKQNVLTNQAIRSTKHWVDKPGKQLVKISALDEGVIIDQVKIYAQ